MPNWLNQFGSLWQSSPQSWAGGTGLQWALLLALAALCGYGFQRRLGLPRVVGYALVGTFAGLTGLSGALWPLEGPVLFALELGAAVVLFECGGRIDWRWFRHNPMVLAQSVMEATLTYLAVFFSLLAMGQPSEVASPLGLIAMAASPIMLSRITADTHASGPVTDRALTLTTLSTLYALTLGAAKAKLYTSTGQSLWQDLSPVLHVLGASIAVAALLYALIRLALRLMSPLSENTALLVLALIAAAAASASSLGGSAPLTGVLGGMLMRRLYPRPLPWSQQLGPISTMLGMVMFVLVASVAAHTPWGWATLSLALILLAARLLAKALGVGLGNLGTGASWRQAFWTASAMAPLSVVALLIAAPFAHNAYYTAEGADLSTAIIHTALPAILLMELLGAVLVTWALRRAGEAYDRQGVRHDA